MTAAADFNTEAKPNWCPGCVLPGTPIHTNPDVKPIEKLAVGDKVLGSDGRYHKITETMSHRHKGRMYRIKSKCFGESVVTDDHPVFVAKREKMDVHNKTLDLMWERADRIKKGDYLGGVIAPGIEISLEALFQKTALLPKIRLAHPEGIIGKDTVESIRAGCSYGIGGLCDRVVDEIKKQLSLRPLVIATGGYAKFMSKYCKRIQKIDPDLVLRGIYYTYKEAKNAFIA